MKINSKAFVKHVQKCIAEDGLNVLESIMAVQEKLEIHEDDLVEIMKREKTLTKDLQTEAMKNNMLKNPTRSADIEDIFE